MSGYVAARKEAHEPDNTDILGGGIVLDACPGCGAVKLSQDLRCSQCICETKDAVMLKRDEYAREVEELLAEIDKIKASLSYTTLQRVEVERDGLLKDNTLLNAAMMRMDKSVKSRLELRDKLLADEQAKVEILAFDKKELLADVARLRKANGVLIGRIRSLETKIAIAALALEKD